MSLKHGLLGLLAYSPMTGYELDKVIKESLSFFWNAQTSQVYRELDTLKKKEWVSSVEVEQIGKPNKNVMSITTIGENELRVWLDMHTAEDMMKFRDGMTMRVFFGSTGDKEFLLKELIDYKRYNEQFIERLTAVKSILSQRAQAINKPTEKKYWLMAISRGHKLAIANIEWVDECLTVLKEDEDLK